MDNSKYDVNDCFFETIDTEQKAYILGFIYADGYNSGYRLQMSQLIQDVDILYQIKEAMESEHPITKGLNNAKHEIATLNINRKCICEDLTKLGAIKNKSLILTFPSFDIVPEHLMHHFIRGYFDGDGCVWDGKEKIYLVKNYKGPGYRYKKVHNVKFNVTGSIDFITGLQNYLINKLGFSKTKLSQKKEDSGWRTMEYSGRRQLKKFHDYIYKDATIYGHRKKETFNKIICALDEKSSSEPGLTAGTPEMVISNQAEKSEGSSTIPEMEVESSDSKCPAPNLKEKDGEIVSSNTK